MIAHASTRNGNGAATMPGAWQPESPFSSSAEQESPPAVVVTPGDAFAPMSSESPFLSEYEGAGASVSALAEPMASLAGELYDREFEESITDLVNEGSALIAEREESEANDPVQARDQSERLLREFYAPLGREAHAVIDRMNAEMGETDLATVAEAEIGERMERFVAPTMPGSPEVFEQFLGKFIKKAKNAVKGAVKLAKKVGSVVGRFMPLNLVLNKLKALINPLLQRVLRFALDKLPVALRPAATQLAQRMLGIKAPAPKAAPAQMAAPTMTQTPGVAPGDSIDAAIAAVSNDGSDSSTPPEGVSGTTPNTPAVDATTADPAEIQEEFDSLLAGSIVGGEAFEQEVVHNAAFVQPPAGSEHALRELRHARDRFARRVVSMRPREDPTPEVEQFIPAVLGAAKLGVKLIGRPKVVKFLAGLVGKHIRRYVGPAQASSLSSALVDTGLRLVHLEASPEMEQLAPGYTLASTVENTVNGLLTSANESAWRDEMLLESSAQEAFEKAAVAAFPDSQIRGELQESPGAPGAWITVPGLAPYEKFSNTPEVTITPEMAEEITSFGGQRLGAVLRAQHALPAHRALRARLHLYRALPGTTLSGIARRERVRGLRSARRHAWSRFHPLTRNAARMLLGHPRLGVDVDPRFLARRERIGAQQRFYYLEVLDPDARVASSEAAAQQGARATQVNAVLDFPARRLTLNAYLAEPDAQELAARVRANGGSRALAQFARPMLQRAIATALGGSPNDSLRVIHPAMPGVRAVPDALLRVLSASGGGVVAQVMEGIMRAMTSDGPAGVATLGESIAHAADAAAEGVTLTFVMQDAPFLPALQRAITAGGGAASGSVARGGAVAVHVTVAPGFVG